MTKGQQTRIAKEAGISAGMLSLILSGATRPGRKSVAGLSRATGIDPIVFLEGTPEQIRDALSGATIREQAA